MGTLLITAKDQFGNLLPNITFTATTDGFISAVVRDQFGNPLSSVLITAQ